MNHENDTTNDHYRDSSEYGDMVDYFKYTGPDDYLHGKTLVIRGVLSKQDALNGPGNEEYRILVTEFGKDIATHSIVTMTQLEEL